MKKNDDLLESGNQLNSEISTSHLNTSLSSEETNELSDGNMEVEAIMREIFLVSLRYLLQLICVGNHI